MSKANDYIFHYPVKSRQRRVGRRPNFTGVMILWNSNIATLVLINKIYHDIAAFFN